MTVCMQSVRRSDDLHLASSTQLSQGHRQRLDEDILLKPVLVLWGRFRKGRAPLVARHDNRALPPPHVVAAHLRSNLAEFGSVDVGHE